MSVEEKSGAAPTTKQTPSSLLHIEPVPQPANGRIELVQFPVDAIGEAEENNHLYGQFSSANPDDAELIRSIEQQGILSPLHISQDGILLDGHRRLSAARICSLPLVPVIIEEFNFWELSTDDRLRVLRSYNRQREKTFSERVAESIVDIDRERVAAEVESFKAERHRINAAPTVEMGDRVERAEITTIQFLDAVVDIVNQCRNEWPISNRAAHYLMLNDPPLTHDSKPDSHYRNELKFSKKLSSILTRARIAGIIPMDAICDDERPVTTWDVHSHAGGFVAEQQRRFLRGYARDLMQSQPHHIEIVVEKRTKYSTACNVAANYTIPVTAGKGFASLAPRHAIAQRYRTSGKDKLILIFATDFDPDGEQIASSFARSMRDDFGITDIWPIKAALNGEQVERYRLPSSLEAKPTSPNYKRFVAKHGTRAVELDAMPSEVLAQVLKDSIESVLDIDAFNHEVEREREEQVEIAARRAAVAQIIGGVE